jgi:Cu-Zn family superoxide dismutase
MGRMPASAEQATAEVRDASGAQKATATAWPIGSALRVRVSGMNLAPGAYGAHVHTTGRCEPPKFDSAGPHWNPTAEQHGMNNPQGMHKGDLPNLMIGSDGRGSMETTIEGASLAGAGDRLMDLDGAALVIHAGADDYRTDPSGNSGGRIACGVFR